VRPLPYTKLMLPRHQQYYGPLRLPLRSPPLHGLPLIGFVAPSPPPGWQPEGLTAGAETGLSCSHDGCPAVPRPLRRRVPRCCASKLFTPSVAFAQPCQARLPAAPSRGVVLDAAGFASCCGPAVCTLLMRARPRASTPRSPQTSAGCYKGSWYLLWPDFHRQVIVDFQDTPWLTTRPNWVNTAKRSRLGRAWRNSFGKAAALSSSSRLQVSTWNRSQAASAPNLPLG